MEGKLCVPFQCVCEPDCVFSNASQECHLNASCQCDVSACQDQPDFDEWIERVESLWMIKFDPNSLCGRLVVRAASLPVLLM